MLPLANLPIGSKVLINKTTYYITNSDNNGIKLLQFSNYTGVYCAKYISADFNNVMQECIRNAPLNCKSFLLKYDDCYLICKKDFETIYLKIFPNADLGVETIKSKYSILDPVAIYDETAHKIMSYGNIGATDLVAYDKYSVFPTLVFKPNTLVALREPFDKANPVYEIAPSSITLSKEPVDMYVGTKIKLSAKFDEPTLNPKLKWTSADPTTVSIDDNGMATILKKGLVNVICTLADE